MNALYPRPVMCIYARTLHRSRAEVRAFFPARVPRPAPHAPHAPPRLAEPAFAGAAVVGCLLIAYAALDWSATPDWSGYAVLYETSGGWLAGRRDPLFVWLLELARLGLGAGGYEAFRHLLVAFFAGGLSLLAWRAPRQFVRPSGVAVLLVIAAAFALKALVHVREGIAMLLAALAVWPYLRGRPQPVRAAVLLLAAVTIHAGALWLAVPVAAAMALRDRRRPAEPWLVGLGLAAGLGCVAGAWIWLDHVRAAMDWIGAERGGGRTPDLAGVLYWAAQGLVCGFLSFRLRALSARAATGAARGTLFIVGTWVVPFTYVLAAGLALGGYPVVALTTISVRLLFTATEFALLLLLGCGGIGALGLLTAAFMLADRIGLARLALGYG